MDEGSGHTQEEWEDTLKIEDGMMWGLEHNLYMDRLVLCVCKCNRMTRQDGGRTETGRRQDGDRTEAGRRQDGGRTEAGRKQ